MVYDADGNLLCVASHTPCDVSAARNYAYTSFDMVDSITQGGATATLA